MTVMAGLDGKAHGGNDLLLPVAPLHKAEGKFAMRAAQARLHAIEFQEHVTDALGGRKVVAYLRHLSKCLPARRGAFSAPRPNQF